MLSQNILLLWVIFREANTSKLIWQNKELLDLSIILLRFLGSTLPQISFDILTCRACKFRSISNIMNVDKIRVSTRSHRTICSYIWYTHSLHAFIIT